MSKLRVASIGVGDMSGCHAGILHENPRTEMACVCDLRKERAAEWAAKLGCDATVDYHDILERDDIDAVMVGVPNGLHFGIALEALLAGKHTAVEYPICQTVAEYDQLAAEASARGLVITDVLTPLIEPQPLAVKSLLPRIGQVMSMQSAYFAGSSDSWYVNEQVRGNFFAALTIHQIIYFNVVLDETPDWVEGALHTRQLESGRTWASGMYMCHYPSGVLAHNDWGMGFDASPDNWYWIVEGTEGRLVYERPKGAPHHVRIQTAGREDEFVEIEPQADAHSPAIESFVNQVLDGAKPYASPEKTREIIGICAAALESAQTGARVPILPRTY